MKFVFNPFSGQLDVIGSHASSHQNAGSDEISVDGLSGLLADDQHVLDAEVLAIAQPLDASLTSIALLGTAANKMAYTTDVDTWAEAAITAAGRSMVAAANAAAQLALLSGAPINSPVFTGDVDISDHDAATVGLKLGGTLITASAAEFNQLDGNQFTSTVNIATTNQDGIIFGSLGTATKGIDMSSSGLSGATDYWLYGSANYYWSADGNIKANSVYAGNRVVMGTMGNDMYAIHGTAARNDLGMLPTGSGNTMISCNFSANATRSFLVGNFYRIAESYDWSGTSGSPTITKATHGLTLLPGELVHIIDGATANEGWYRIVSSTVDTIVLSHNITSNDEVIDIMVYKDIIGFFPTDGTNGQRIMNYSAQDKPLQLGGDTYEATGHSLGSEDILIGGNLFEVNADAYFDGAMQFGTHAAITTETLSGFITITDSGGATRKLAVVA